MHIQSLRYSRLIHNTLIFTISLFISFYSHIPFAFWVSATVLVIMLPMDSQQVQERISGVFWGSVHGLILFIPLWIIIDINGGLIFLIIPLSLALTNFFQIYNFSRNVAFLNINLGLFLEYMQYGNYHFSAYFVARFMTIIIGVALAGIGDFFFTHRKNYGLHEFNEAVNKLNTLIAGAQIHFNSLHREKLNERQEYDLINHINSLNLLSTTLNNSFKSILVEQEPHVKNLITKHYGLLPGLIKQYKVELFALGYAISSRLIVTEYKLRTLITDINASSEKILTATQKILQVH